MTQTAQSLLQEYQQAYREAQQKAADQIWLNLRRRRAPDFSYVNIVESEPCFSVGDHKHSRINWRKRKEAKEAA